MNNPYAEAPTDNLRTGTDLFGSTQLLIPRKKNTRGELVLFFEEALKKNRGYMFQRLKHVSTDDLFYIKSVFEDKRRRPCGDCLKAGMTGSCAHSFDRAKSFFNWATETKKA
jgi:hypothetical protein